MLSKINQLYLRRLPFFLGIMAMTQFSSCEKDDAVDVKNSLQPQEQKEQPLNYRALFSSHHTIGLDEAKDVALDASSMFDGGDNGLKSGKARTIGEVRVLQSDKNRLRSGSSKALDLPDTLAYLVNFEDNAGYAIVCADDRVGCPLLAYVPEGSSDDAESNPSLSAVLSNMKDCLLNSIEDFEAKKDSMRKVAE
ncbi:MAG: Spi family protease inhibitor, partial [Paludibacteraceae bacterium]|nr:Spi family protease inhibitor [Paludibacteraceae bacterium]